MLCALAIATVSGPLTLSLIGQNVGEVDGQRFGIDGGDHLFARLHLDQLRAGLPDLVIEGVAVALLNDNFGSAETR